MLYTKFDVKPNIWIYKCFRRVFPNPHHFLRVYWLIYSNNTKYEDFFECTWLGGVKKTSFFHPRPRSASTIFFKRVKFWNEIYREKKSIIQQNYIPFSVDRRLRTNSTYDGRSVDRRSSGHFPEPFRSRTRRTRKESSSFGRPTGRALHLRHLKKNEVEWIVVSVISFRCFKSFFARRRLSSSFFFYYSFFVQ